MGRKLSLLESMKLKKGDTFEFGMWNYLPIEWQVLATRGGIFCISRYCLATRRFDKSSSIWEYSELRQWVNSEFFNKAFNFEEKSFLLPYEGDKVTLLSEEEAKKYLPTNSKRVATKRNGNWAWWWLRSRGEYASDVAFVDNNGAIDYTYYVGVASGAVRPAILLKKDVENYLEPEV